MYNSANLILNLLQLNYGMKWIKPNYSETEVNNAGRTLIKKQPSPSREELDEATKILDNWRGAHSYPMHVFKVRLKGEAKKVDKNALTAQRLKRVPAIIYKLTRQYSNRKNLITLFEMQDIGGCRAIMPNVMLAKQLYELHYQKGNLKHKAVKINDYITKPKNDGYRSFHIVYAYHSDKGKKAYNGLLVELQFRSKLQHLWATAVEVVGFITQQAIKTNEGSEEWNEFFKLLSSAFAQIEKCPQVPNTPTDEKELYLSIKKKENELNLVNRLEIWTAGLNKMKNWSAESEDINKNSKKKKHVQYFLLELNLAEKNLLVTAYKDGEETKAIEDYNAAEKKHHGEKQYDVVLVGVDSAKELEKAYPNYFADTKEFLKELRKILNKY
ncbi:Region found in RelA / SpoT proteins [uncultured archaeon]|nr:Region found in RelA / SpoT proteins [uncultured archaeon]